MSTVDGVREQIAADMAALDCIVSLHVRCLSDEVDFALDADRPMIMASIFKPFAALELFAQAAQGDIDPAERIRSCPANRVPGPTGLSKFQDEVELSLRDLAHLMVTVSDNEATDLLLTRLGLDKVKARMRAMGCANTLLRSTIGDMLNALGRELGFANYHALLDAQEGRLGAEAQCRATDQVLIDACAALDPARGSVATARDMTGALAAIWRDDGAPPKVCAQVRALMAAQVTRRLEPAVPPGGSLAAKSDGLFGRVRNEIGVIRYPDEPSYAVAILTHTTAGFGSSTAIDHAMAKCVDRAIRAVSPE